MATAETGARYRIEGADALFTPALVVFPELIRANLAATIERVGDPARLRPHSKTHKTIELTRLCLDAGITKHKCATFAEAETLAAAGAKDIVFAYSLVGPNIARFVNLARRYPDVSFKPLVDHPGPTEALNRALKGAGLTAEVLLDLDVGMGRTGITPGADALALYRQIAESKGLVPAGLHLYDGQSHQCEPAERGRAVDLVWESAASFVRALESEGLPVPRLVCGNSPTFPRWADLASRDARIECSPGTFFLNDWNYFRDFTDLPFPPAAVLLTRVVSVPRPGRITLDLGYKAVSPDSPVAKRVRLLELPDAQLILQNEEHLVIESPAASRFEPGDLLLAWPGHICPTVALHKELIVVENGRVTGTWAVVARDRVLGV